MPKRKRSDDDYDEFCDGLQGSGDTSYVVSSNGVKRPRLNPNFQSVNYHFGSSVVTYRNVFRWEQSFTNIQNLITNDSIVIDDITEVNNEVLMNAYYFTKGRKLDQFGRKMQEALLFHGTKEENLESICKYNFDWRLYGKNKGHKFGKGVNFSTNAKYASNYSDHNSYYKVMIVARVLIGKICPGHHDMSIPPWGYDTSQKGKNGVVIVKYEDNEFYPAFILRYHFRDRYDYSDGRRCQSYDQIYDSYGYHGWDYGANPSYYNHQYYNSQNYSGNQYSDYSSYYSRNYSY